ncbi:sirohydrochlorin cobaltochelatase [Clostridiaceae bacterium M8S5]|nr:sirohydrochlorin cobaltochelatase [Clostridiaceae bacterium M8S5]
MSKCITVIFIILLSFIVLIGCTNSQIISKNVQNSKRAVLVISFGTSHNETRKLTIEATENKIAKAFPGYDLKRAFTSEFIIKKLKKRDNLEIDNVKEALDKLVKNGYSEVIIQPLHIMNGSEYHDTLKIVGEYKDKFKKVNFGNPLLTSPDDYINLVDALSTEMPNLKENEALFFMGHGTHHFSNSAYACLDYTFKYKGHENVYVGTVEGFPTLDTILKITKNKGYKKVYLMPLMLVAGDHATNDMAGKDDDSWRSILESKGYAVEPILKGLGQIESVQELYVNHLKESLKKEKRED